MSSPTDEQVHFDDDDDIGNVASGKFENGKTYQYGILQSKANESTPNRDDFKPLPKTVQGRVLLENDIETVEQFFLDNPFDIYSDRTHHVYEVINNDGERILKYKGEGIFADNRMRPLKESSDSDFADDDDDDGDLLERVKPKHQRAERRSAVNERASGITENAIMALADRLEHGTDNVREILESSAEKLQDVFESQIRSLENQLNAKDTAIERLRQEVQERDARIMQLVEEKNELERKAAIEAMKREIKSEVETSLGDQYRTQLTELRARDAERLQQTGGAGVGSLIDIVKEALPYAPQILEFVKSFKAGGSAGGAVAPSVPPNAHAATTIVDSGGGAPDNANDNSHSSPDWSTDADTVHSPMMGDQINNNGVSRSDYSDRM